jgi:uncharacterized protein YkwD
MGGCATKDLKIKNDDKRIIIKATEPTKENIENHSNKITRSEGFIREAIDEHNKYRKLHRVDPLLHDPDLSKYSQIHADKIASQDVLNYSDCRLDDKQIGENIAVGASMTAKTATDIWYDEVREYNFDSAGFNMNTGHFTQVVWKDTRYMGIGIAVSQSGTCYIVSNYYPPGNVNGYFEYNVLPKGY